MAEVTMPRLSDTMSEGAIGKWLKSPGDQVEQGDIIAEIETDKAIMELGRPKPTRSSARRSSPRSVATIRATTSSFSAGEGHHARRRSVSPGRVWLRHRGRVEGSTLGAPEIPRDLLQLAARSAVAR